LFATARISGRHRRLIVKYEDAGRGRSGGKAARDLAHADGRLEFLRAQRQDVALASYDARMPAAARRLGIPVRGM
jgi:hypothetical protein